MSTLTPDLADLLHTLRGSAAVRPDESLKRHAARHALGNDVPTELAD